MAPVNLEGPPPYSLLQNSVECLPYLENQPRGTFVKTHIGVSKLMCCHCHKVKGVKITSEIITTGLICLKDCTCGLSPVPSLLDIKGLWIAYAQNDQGRIRSSTAQDERSICSGPASTFLENANRCPFSTLLRANVEAALSIGHCVQPCQEVRVVPAMDLGRCGCATSRSLRSGY